jgi:membrane protein implicated in regulation of membrane protease activity
MRAAELKYDTRVEEGRGWSWAAVVSAVVVWAAGLPTWGLSVVLAPLSSILSVVAWRRSRHDGVFG